MTTALIADDEPLLRGALESLLARAWPQLQVVAQARNGREAIRLFDAMQPAVCFLDVHMPGVSGIDVAHHIGRRAHVVFVTAYDTYAVQAFAQGVLDYLVKPVEPSRLAETVARLQERLRTVQPASNTEALLRELAAQLEHRTTSTPLRWIRAQVGQSLRLISVDDIDYLRSESKYTLVAWRGETGQPSEALISSTLKELTAQLDPSQFVQVHRSVLVNLRAISYVSRGDNETATVHLKDRKEQLPVSRSYSHLFRQM
ncbi:LytR/AlgR family response regulator transcription factor [Dyella sp. 20L07]|uniref:LytR/AlgR family response regulator transcription factor n=1 Tax=Dyella sp. 20L07 TaxID=3384240 RepID=UPI003D2D070A